MNTFTLFNNISTKVKWLHEHNQSRSARGNAFCWKAIYSKWKPLVSKSSTGICFGFNSAAMTKPDPADAATSISIWRTTDRPVGNWKTCQRSVDSETWQRPSVDAAVREWCRRQNEDRSSFPPSSRSCDIGFVTNATAVTRLTRKNWRTSSFRENDILL